MDYPDAENVLQLLISKNHSPGPNSSFYSNPEFDKMFTKLKLLSDGKEKFELMNKMEKIILKDVPWIMHYYSRRYILHYNYVRNYRHSDIIFRYMKYLKLK